MLLYTAQIINVHQFDNLYVLCIHYSTCMWFCDISQVLHDASQESVYETCAQELVVQLMRGFNGTLLAYGETGAGNFSNTLSVVIITHSVTVSRSLRSVFS